MKLSTFVLVGGVLLGGTTFLAKSQAQTGAVMLLNPSNLDFEKGLDGWTDKDTLAMSQASPEAAHSGKMGLRLSDNDPRLGSGLSSPQVAIEPNTSYELSFWAKTKVKSGAGVWVRFYDANHMALSVPLTQITGLSDSSGEWKEYKAIVPSPAQARYLSFWIHSYTAAQGNFDFDDFSLVAKGAAAPSPEPVKVEVPAPVTRKTPAYIMIKVDDLIAANGGVNPRWQKLVDFTRARKIKAGIGIIANSLEKENPVYFNWIKEQQATGLFEFWNHGYDHKRWEENGKPLEEFKGTSYELQKQHLERSDALAREKLGFPFRTFGAPFNGTDENTVKALETESDIKTWLYGDLKTPAGKVVLDRVGAVNIEAPTFVPDVQKFAQGYNRYPDRDFFVIQGHPAQWDEPRFQQFVAIVDFLTKAGAIFVTPSEYTKLKHPE